MQSSVIRQILKGIEAGKKQFDRLMDEGDCRTEDTSCDKYVQGASIFMDASSELCRGDNLTYMKELLSRGYGGRLSLIYIDPPFFTRSSFNASIVLKDRKGNKKQIHHLAYDDKFDRSLEYYIENMSVRLLMMRELIADDGLMWVHLDWHSSHYIRLVMDELMGEKNFVNEIIWCYKSGGSGKRHFARKHDSILVYSKTKDYYLNVPLEKSYNRDHKPYRFKGVEEYKDDIGWYTMVNMKDVWNIDMVGRTSAERTGYATQKPMELMKRILESSSQEGDIVGDFFCGSGSFTEAAESLGRIWLGCDSERLAVSIARKRLRSCGAAFSFISKDEEKPMSGRASIKVDSKDALDDGRYMYKCSLTDIVPVIDMGSIQMKDREDISAALADNRLQFADHIMVDVNKEHRTGSEFTCDHIFSEDFTELIFIADSDFRAIVVDVFGKEYLADVDNA